MVPSLAWHLGVPWDVCGGPTMGSDRSTLSSLHASDTLRHAAVSVGLAEWSCVLNYLVLIKLSYKIDELFKKIFFFPRAADGR